MILHFSDAALAAWAEADKRATCSLRDHEIIEQTFSIRALIIELAKREPADDDLYDACACLGRLVARQHGSPTLASVAIDHAREALGGSVEAAWLVGARAAACEGFSGELAEMERAEALRAWEFPRCAVTVTASEIAIAAGHPADEREVLEAWAARAAKAAALLGVRRAFVSGRDAPRRAMVEALDVAGIEVVDAAPFEGWHRPGYDGSRT
jgi:hypothetical protein